MASKRVKKALRHEDVYGAGAKARREADLEPAEEYEAIEHERKQGTLHAGGSGSIVTDPKQAKAIAASEIRRKGRKHGNMDGNVHGEQY